MESQPLKCNQVNTEGGVLITWALPGEKLIFQMSQPMFWSAVQSGKLKGNVLRERFLYNLIWFVYKILWTYCHNSLVIGKKLHYFKIFPILVFFFQNKRENGILLIGIAFDFKPNCEKVYVTEHETKDLYSEMKCVLYLYW